MKPIVWPFPLKGWSRGSAYADQPPLTSPDLCNVLPRDTRHGRVRGAQRAGLLKLNADALAGAVTAMMSVNVPLGTGSFVAGVEIEYGSSQENELIEDFDEWGTSYYVTANASGVGKPGSSSTNTSRRHDCTANGVIQGNNGSDFNGMIWTALADDPFINGGGVDVTARAYTNFSGTTTHTHLGLVVNVDTSGSEDNGLILIFNRGNIQLLNTGGGLLASNTFTAVDDEPFDVRLTIDAEGNYVAYLGGVSRLSGTIGSYATLYGDQTGFAIATPGTSAGRGSNGGNDKGFYSLAIGDSFVFPEGNFERKLVVIAGGSIYVGTSAANLVAASGGGVTAGIRPGMAHLNGKVYITDGVDEPKVLDLSDNSVSSLTASEGTVPPDMKMCAAWRGRLVLAGEPDNPQNFYMSKAGDPTNWDYSEGSPVTAVAGNAASTFGHIGDPITAIMPFADDTLVFGTADGLFRITGDLAAGGSIDQLVRGIGVVGPFAWAHTPDGHLFFVGEGGLYTVAPGGGVEASLALDRCDEYFASLDADTHYITLAWDEPRHGLWIFKTPLDSEADAERHLWWDARTNGFFPQETPIDTGPTSACWFRAFEEPAGRILVGGHDGFIRAFDDDTRQDDDAAISPVYVVFEPIVPAGEIQEAKLLALDIIGGELASGDAATDWNMGFKVGVGDDIHAALDSITPATDTDGTVTAAGRAPTQRIRRKGVAFVLCLNNAVQDEYFSVERIIGRFELGGRVRP